MPDNFKNFSNSVYNIPEVSNGLIQIDLYQSSNHPDAVELGAIWSHVERGKGHATSVMKSIFELADEFSVDIYGEPYFLVYDIDARELEGESDEELDRLIALNERRLSNEQLLGWYQRLGFEITDLMRGDQPEIVRRSSSPTPKP